MLCNNFKNGGLKHVDISSKIISFQCSWPGKLFYENFHEWKIIPSCLMSNYFGKSFKFYSFLSFDSKLLIKFPEFYKIILFQWSSSLFGSKLLCCILSNFLWFSKHILIAHLFSLFFWHRHHLFALSANLLMRQCSMYFTNAIKSKNYGMTWFYSSKISSLYLL